MKKIFIIFSLFSVINLSSLANAAPIKHYEKHHTNHHASTHHRIYKPTHNIRPQFNYHIHQNYSPCHHRYSSNNIFGGLVIGAILGGITGAIID